MIPLPPCDHDGCSKLACSKSNTEESRILEWCEEAFHPKTIDGLVLKLFEESGEVAGAAVKIPEGRATWDDFDDEVGDVLIVLSQIAAKRGTTLKELLQRRFEFIQQRRASKQNKE